MISLAKRNGIVHTLQGHVVALALLRASVRCNEEKAGGANIYMLTSFLK
jgi:hypothetical protein